VRISTGIFGLDLVLSGGMEAGSVVVLAGSPGTGKTIIAQQICFANATPEHKAVYYTTMSEPHDKLVRHLEQFTFFDPASLGATIEHIHLGDFLTPERQDGLTSMVSEIVRKTLDEEPSVVVIDSAKMLIDFVDRRELRTALYQLVSQLSDSRALLLLLGEYGADDVDDRIEFAIADGILQLRYEESEPIDRRSLRVMKMRAASHLPGKHSLRIGPDGVEVFPRIETQATHPITSRPGRVPSGIPGLDGLMNGGARSSDATLLMGPSGVGKTIFSLRWIAEALEQGERALYVSFQDTEPQLLALAASFGWDFSEAMKSGQLVISHLPTGDLDLDVFATGIQANLGEAPPSRVVIDSLAELVLANREAERFPAYARSLVGMIRAAGSSLLLTSESTSYGFIALSMNAFLFLFDNVIDLRYVEQGSEIGRAVNIVKMRSSKHEMSLNSVTISNIGLVVGERLEGVSGRLGWTALRTESPSLHALT
jgi:circadian clock protein KaiC